MRPAIYKVHEVEQGFLAIMPRPQPGDWLHDDIRGLRQFGVTCLVSLLERGEEEDLILSHERELAESAGMEFLSYPIRDRNVPANVDSFTELVLGIADRVRQGHGVGVHCRAGIGRSGITVSATLVTLGIDPSSVFEMVSEARGFPVPDTAEQEEWFRRHCMRFSPQQ